MSTASARTAEPEETRADMSASPQVAKRAAPERPDRCRHASKRFKQKSHKKNKGPVVIDGLDWLDGSVEDVLCKEIKAMVQQPLQQDEDKIASCPLPELYSELEVDVVRQSSSGDGLAFSKDQRHVYVVPFTMPGDRALVRPWSHQSRHFYSLTDFLAIIKPSDRRHDDEIKCQYFTKCGGCQFQMMAPADQLAHKQEVVQRAYTQYVRMNPALLPQVEATLASPLQYAYRTKLTPHFDNPEGTFRRRGHRQGPKPVYKHVPPIGFNSKVKGKQGGIIDIEECPIATPAIQYGLTQERKRIADTISEFHRGATILIRESTEKMTDEPADSAALVVVQQDHGWHVKTYTSNPHDTIKEYIGPYFLTNLANSFFQNNNAILTPFIDYIRSRIAPSSAPPALADPKYLVDAYCGCGLFTITLSSLFHESIGIDIDDHSIRFARKNAELNGLSNASFLTATASAIFGNITFPADDTLVIIDPPRKGCDLAFLTQLLEFAPRRIIYVSCNVHTQARDVNFLLSGGLPGSGETGMYSLESLRGCDFFPQTHHVEAVAILQKKQTPAF